MRMSRPWLVLATLAVAPALTACITVNNPGTAPTSTAAEASPRTTAPVPSAKTPRSGGALPSATSSQLHTAGAPVVGVTPTPGQTLAPRTTAILDYKWADKTTKLAVTPVSVTRGSMGDLGSYTIPDNLRDTTPYYVTATYRNVGTETLHNAIPHISLDAGTHAAKFPTAFVGMVDQCKTNAPLQFAPQQSYTACRVFFARPGETVTKLRWRRSVVDDELVFWNVS